MLDGLRGLWTFNPDIEITLEANPGSVDEGNFRGYAKAGVNRLSLGIQSLRPDDLTFLGRQHSVQQAKSAISLAKSCFPRFSFDLIYARPHQSVVSWTDELNEALSFGPQHLSLYQLTIEPGTAFHTKYIRGELVIPNDIVSTELYEETGAIMTSHGLRAYEVSNYAVPGQECLHNLTYWRYEDYIGLGPGAHGRITMGDDKWATQNIKSPEFWVKAVQDHSHGLKVKTSLTENEKIEEALVMGLRLEEGVLMDRFPILKSSKSLATLVEENLLQKDGGRLKATPEGRLKLNAVLTYLLSA